MKQFKYISQITNVELEDNYVIPCINDDGYHSILIKNSANKTNSNTTCTDNLEVKFNAVLSYQGNNYYFHIITSKKNDFVANSQFEIVFEYLFKKTSSAILDSELSSLISSIEEYFRITAEADTRNLQIGVFGELLFIKIMYDNGYKDILKKYHQNFYSKHDVEISDKTRIEIKTTSKEKRIHRFRHNQIHRSDVNVYVASSMLEPSQEGLSLYELFDEIIKLYDDPDAAFSLNKLMKKCNVSADNQGLKFALQKACDDYRFFDAKVLPQIESDIPNGVSLIEYDVDCSTADGIALKDFIKLL